MRPILFPFALSALLSACVTTTASSVSTFYDYHFTSPQGHPISLAKLPSELLTADIILVGEWHTHSAIHRFQTDILRQLNDQGIPVTLSMEQFSRDAQSIVDQYLAGDIGEQPLITEGNAWPNYESDYRPLMEYAKQNNLDVIAANAPKHLVRCIGRLGTPYVETLSQPQRQLIAQNIDTQDSAYKRQFMSSMHHGISDQTERMFAAQMSWDETMAESMIQYLAAHPNKTILHIAGKFHVQQGLGLKTSLLKRNPDLNIAVITPIGTQNAEANITDNTAKDYLLWVLDPPARFIKDENRIKAFQKLSHRNDDLSCK
ncbi:ChaN family lipoprotein [Vibrio sp. NTOU-M3]|uniref:ChaN family lipoprotein n=1 Tax=Vibrio sp. NTOU-M3 TaxID=3234954 RepID=UPI00349F43C0